MRGLKFVVCVGGGGGGGSCNNDASVWAPDAYFWERAQRVNVFAWKMVECVTQ